MICHRCLRQGPFPFHRLIVSSPRRLLSDTSPSHQQQSPPAATSTSAAQPFSTPFTPSPSNSMDPTKASTSSESAEPSLPRSSLKAGTPLKGLAFLKNKDPPVAKEDKDYPDWLWGLLDQGKFGRKGEIDGGSGEGDAFSKSAKQRRVAARLARRSASTSSSESRAPPVPLHQQSVDLPSAPQNRFGRDVDIHAGEKAREAREELTASLRQKRRKSIKEGNFLRGMR
ncbi:MAG: hypothetical protein Q9184_001660 [Pyrenodesmia sp. 2 TL-2023]